MSCCGCNPCQCAPVNCTPAPCCVIQLPENSGIEYTFENINTAGVGFLAGVDGTNVQFRGLASESNALTVTLDAPSNTIILDFNDELLIDDIPTATETQRGIAEIATQAETNAGVVDNVILTPLKLAARTATETRSGIAELATQAETNAGINDATIVTPLKLGTWWTAKLSAPVTFASDVTVSGAFTTGGIVTDELTVASGGFAVTTKVFFIMPISFESGNTFELEGATIADSVLATGASGELAPLAISDFISNENTQTGWSVTNPVTARTIDVSAATLGEVREVLGTLINDLKSVKLPAT